MEFTKKIKIEPDRTIVAMAQEERTVNGKTSTDIRFFLTSLDNIELVKKSIPLYWGIENRQFRQTVLRLL